MPFLPDISALLKRPHVTRPIEEVLLAPPDDETLPDPARASVDSSPAAAPTEPLAQAVDALYQEAAELGTLYDLIATTASPLTVPVAPTEQSRLGEAVTVPQYLAAAASSEDPHAHRKQRHFEQSLLSGCGQQADWPLLAAPSLKGLQETLLTTAALFEGQTLAASPLASGGTAWGQSVLASRYMDLHGALLVHAKTYRARLSGAILTLDADAESEFLNRLLEDVVGTDPARIRAELGKLCTTLETLRSVLCHAQLLKSFEHHQSRDAFLALVQNSFLRQLLGMLSVLYSKVEQRLVGPVVDLLLSHADNGGAITYLGELASSQIVTTITETVTEIHRSHLDIVADLLRQLDSESTHRLGSLQALGERSLYGQWMSHLDETIAILRRGMATGRPIDLPLLVEQARQARPRTRSPLRDQLKAQPERFWEVTPFVPRTGQLPPEAA